MSRVTFTEQDPNTVGTPSEDNGTRTVTFFAADDTGQLRPKGRDSDGNLIEFIGPSGAQGVSGDTGPQGPEGAPGTVSLQDVADISNPTEIEVLTLMGVGRSLFVRQDVAVSGDIFTNYVYDDSGPVRNPPYVMDTGDGGTTRWIANTSHFTQHSPMAADGSRFINVAEISKLAGIASGATNTPLSNTAPGNVTKSAASAGIISEASRVDHKHDIDTAIASTITDSTNSEGSSASLSRADHGHSHGNRTGGSLHSAATTSVAGFLSAADKTKLDALPTSIPDFYDANVEMHDDFPPIGTATGQVGQLGWISDSAGTAATVVKKDGVSGHPGIITIRPGTVAGGRAGIAMGSDGLNNFCILGDGSVQVTWVVRSAQSLAAFEMMIMGLGDVNNTTGDQNNGVYFQLLTADTNWQIVTASAGTRTRVNTGIAYVANTWFKLKLTVNAAGTSVQANINGVDVGTAITTNIPTVAVSPIFKVDGIAGGTASDTDADYFKFLKTLTVSR